jgi:hypothetical protein
MTTLTKIFLWSAFLTLLFPIEFSQYTYAKENPFVLLEAHRQIVTKTQLDSMESAHAKTQVSKNGSALILSGNRSDLIVRTGPESDMLSYRVEGIRNPVLIVRSSSILHILFVNVDDDMTHDLRMGDVTPPDTIGTVGSARLPHSDEDNYSAEEMILRIQEVGKYPYFCSYKTHAANGMRGWIIIVDAGASSDEMMQLAMDTSGTFDEMGMGSMHERKQGVEEMQMGDMTGMNMEHSMEMSGMLRNESMSQEGSGTSWMPASSPMYMWMNHCGGPDDWTLILHGDIMPRYDHQGGPRGANKFDAPNWFMAMAGHPIGPNGQLTAHVMMSLDRLTEGGKGYPLLLQTGETWQRVKLVDVQHPHDLFDEISAAYSQRFSDNSSAYLYLGYPGEPALGPPVFMHRPSAMSNPNAPLSHHWMDATHITFGVATAGIAVATWKLEGSYFNGSEPDENRYNFDQLKLNSYSGRLSFNPTDNLSFQISSGFLNNPEGDSVDVVRTTASAIYTKKFESGNWWSTTAAWGQNHEVDHLNLEALLIESQYDWKCWTFYGRAEYIQKTNGELSIIESPNKINDVEAITFGLTRKLFRILSLDVELGGQGTYNFIPPSLVLLYTEHTLSYEIYFAIHPSLM